MPIPPMRLVALFVALTALTHPSFAQGRGGGRGGRTGGAAVAAASAPEGKRLLRVADMYNLRNVGGLQISPDGEWVLYTVSQLDSVRDRSQSDLYLARWDGSLTRRLTYSPDGEGSPRFSPDGRYVSFLSSRGAPRGARRSGCSTGTAVRPRSSRRSRGDQRLRMVAGRDAAGADHARPGSGG